MVKITTNMWVLLKEEFDANQILFKKKKGLSFLYIGSFWLPSTPFISDTRRAKSVRKSHAGKIRNVNKTIKIRNQILSVVPLYLKNSQSHEK